MRKSFLILKCLSLILPCGVFLLAAEWGQVTAVSSAEAMGLQTQAGQTVPAVEEWGDNFGSSALDTAKWERFTFEGGGGGKSQIKEGQLQQRSFNGTRAGVRSKKSWRADKFYVEASLAKVGAALPDPAQPSSVIGNAIVTILFDGSGANRLEWVLTSEGTLEAWAILDRRGERLDNRQLGTKAKSPRLGIARRGDEVYFMLNGQIGLQKTIRNLPPTFTVMLYGYGSSENNWDAVLVQTPKGS
jgi:hypothetical protein